MGIQFNKRAKLQQLVEIIQISLNSDATKRHEAPRNPQIIESSISFSHKASRWRKIKIEKEINKRMNKSEKHKTGITYWKSKHIFYDVISFSSKYLAGQKMQCSDLPYRKLARLPGDMYSERMSFSCCVGPQ